MNERIDAYMAAFIAFAKQSDAPVADIGSAYGVATIAALEAGATVIAVDVDARHLEILEQRVSSDCTARLRTIAASFPEALTLDHNSIGAFLLSQVVHFLTPPRLQLAARRLFDWLKPGGKVFLVAVTPYLGHLKTFVPEYEARRKSGQPWPGYVSDVMKYAPTHWKNAPSRMLFLDPETLSRVFLDAGLVVEKAEFIERPDIPPVSRLDGRESVGLIARKAA